MSDPYLHPAAIELAALATFIRAGHIRDSDLRDSKLLSPVALFCEGVQHGYIQACRPIVLQLAEAMREAKFVGNDVVKANANNYVEAMVNRKLTAEAIRTFIRNYARPPNS